LSRGVEKQRVQKKQRVVDNKEKGEKIKKKFKVEYRKIKERPVLIDLFPTEKNEPVKRFIQQGEEILDEKGEVVSYGLIQKDIEAIFDAETFQIIGIRHNQKDILHYTKGCSEIGCAPAYFPLLLERWWYGEIKESFWKGLADLESQSSEIDYQRILKWGAEVEDWIVEEINKLRSEHVQEDEMEDES